MAELLKVECPECRCTLFVERATGRVVEVRKPVSDQMKGEDRFDALFRKAKNRGDAAMQKFAEAQEREKTKLDRLNSLFEETKDRVEESGDIGPEIRDMDMD
jgi:hypothetical protein